MPQASFDKASELHTVRAVLQVDELRKRTLVTLLGFNRDGVLLASSGVVLTGFAECELLPDMLREAAVGFLWSDARDAVVRPAEHLRQRRSELARATV